MDIAIRLIFGECTGRCVGLVHGYGQITDQQGMRMDRSWKALTAIAMSWIIFSVRARAGSWCSFLYYYFMTFILANIIRHLIMLNIFLYICILSLYNINLFIIFYYRFSYNMINMSYSSKTKIEKNW